MAWQRWTSLHEVELASIHNSTCGDPFSILGCHPLQTDKGIKTSIRVFLPGASFVRGEFLSHEGEFDFSKIGETGFFEAILDMEYEHLLYSLMITLENGITYKIIDPYAFGPVLTDFDLHLMTSGTHYELYRKLGANLLEHEGQQGVLFAVWAPMARSVSVVGNFNSWDGRRHILRSRGSSGIWELFIPGITEGDLYKFEIHAQDGSLLSKIDPMAKFAEVRPNVASIVARLDGFAWTDQHWMDTKRATDVFGAPMNIYEVHPGSWRRDPNDPQRFLNWEELANDLIPYVKDMGYTHIELMPVMEHPLDESWGYQVTGYYAPSSRFGTPDQFRTFVDQCHLNDLGVILDWVPAHFPKDSFALGRFDGSAVYEHEDPRQGEHPHWGTYIFNFARNEVSNFLISNAMYWLREFHCDGLRVDAVASMLYLDYGKEEGGWVPNRDGGNFNYDAIEFLKHLNSIMGKYARHAIFIAEESTSFPCISRPPEQGGLGFHYKWNMGWMNDFLGYMQKEPVHRKYHQNALTFAMIYAYSENFILVLSHDEVVHGKGSMIQKMPGDWWQKFANLRLAYAYMYAHPGKKLLFMGQEFAQFSEWNAKQSLDWHLTSWDPHRRMQGMMKNLGNLYKNEAALWEIDHHNSGFEWIWCDDADNSVVSFVRKSAKGELILCAFNFTPVPRNHYRIGAPAEGKWVEVFNSDSELWGGGNVGNYGACYTENIGWQNRPWSFNVNIPPLAGVYLKYEA